MTTQKLQDRIAEFEKALIKCLLDFDDKGVREAHNKIKHIKNNFLDDPMDHHQQRFQELLDEYCGEECGFDEHFDMRTQLGKCYLYGRGVKEDEEVGLELLEQETQSSYTACFILENYFRDISKTESLKWGIKGESLKEEKDFITAHEEQDERDMAEFIYQHEKNNYKVA